MQPESSPSLNGEDELTAWVKAHLQAMEVNPRFKDAPEPEKLRIATERARRSCGRRRMP